jgi:hypothetical protein
MLGFGKIAQKSKIQNILVGGHGSLTIQMQRTVREVLMVNMKVSTAADLSRYVIVMSPLVIGGDAAGRLSLVTILIDRQRPKRFVSQPGHDHKCGLLLLRI